MKDYWKKFIVIGAIALIIILWGVWYYNQGGVPADKTLCDEESRQAAFCIELYEPVCGWNNEDIKCIKYPCAQDYSNPCFACKDKNVEYYTIGECPK